ncbi:class II aldolase/adducin family protein [Carboxylicivirga sp. M1479]|uniref:class II aldolase/adducin family protein n=1 Tax=Carboxylicivirga sp. M1479 TaxID=2594476 RepID=UPI001178080D|nr:class II aldolase/adducin family protein [Carboxylicivirga sp. M1479]TRX71742.1 class II aldolase/adducin family protein [Carboxylicivirga sp. M1479]
MHKESWIKDKKEVAKWMRRLYKKGLTTSLGGNISMRLDDDLIGITASETDKGKIKAKGIAIVTMQGKVVDSSLKVSMETGMHLAIYKTRPDVKAIVHAHAPMGSLFVAMDREVNTHLLAEAYTILGQPGMAEYGAPGSKKLADKVALVSKTSNVILMKNHGVLAVGSSMLQAFDRIEVLENAAKMTVLTSMLNNKDELNNDQIAELKNLFG